MVMGIKYIEVIEVPRMVSMLRFNLITEIYQGPAVSEWLINPEKSWSMLN